MLDHTWLSFIFKLWQPEDNRIFWLPFTGVWEYTSICQLIQCLKLKDNHVGSDMIAIEKEFF